MNTLQKLIVYNTAQRINSLSWLANYIIWFLYLRQALITAITEIQMTTSYRQKQLYLFLLVPTSFLHLELTHHVSLKQKPPCFTMQVLGLVLFGFSFVLYDASCLYAHYYSARELPVCTITLSDSASLALRGLISILQGAYQRQLSDSWLLHQKAK